MKFNHLNVPERWQHYWTRYPEGYTILEALISWVSQVDNMVDSQNKLTDNVAQFRDEIDAFIERFDERLQDEVTQTLQDWQASGFLDVVISEALQWELDNYIATNEADKLSITTQLAQITTLITNYSNLVVNGDWSNAIQTAHDEAVENQEIFFPIGTYEFSNVNITKPIKINGEGTLVKKKTEEYLFNVNFTNKKGVFSIKNVTIDGNESGVISKEDIFIQHVEHVIMKGVTFTNPSKTSLRVVSNVDKIDVINCCFINGTPSGFTGSDVGHVFHFRNDASAYLVVKDCLFTTDIIYIQDIQRSPLGVFSSNAKNAIIMGNQLINAGHIDMYSQNHGCMVTGNIVEGCHWDSIKVQESRDITVTNNVIRNQKKPLSNTIIIQSYPRASSYGSLEREQYYGVVANNTIENCSGGIYIGGNPLNTNVSARDPLITQDDLRAKGYMVQGNILRNIGRTAIRLQLTENITIANNYIHNFGLEGETPSFNSSAILLDRITGEIRVMGNTIKGDGNWSKHGIATHIDNSLATIMSTYVSVSDNNIENTTNYPVFLRYVETLDILNNYINADLSAIIYVRNVTTARIEGNRGFDTSNINRIQTVDIENLISESNRKTQNLTWSTEPPTIGTYVRGDMVMHPNPSAGMYIGWICVIQGTPGTWKGFGLIES